MAEYLQRDQAPLGPAEWAAIDQAVVRTAQSVLVGRRFINLVGPFGPGVEALPNDVLSGGGGGRIDLLGNAEDEQLSIENRRFLPLPLLYKDFWIHWRDLESSRLIGVPLDVGKPAAAAAATAQTEDRLIFDGDAGLGLPGLRTVEGRQQVPMSDWSSMGRAFSDVVEAVRVLTQAGFTGPYTLAVSPRLYADLNRIFDATGVLELEQVEKLARRGVYPTAALPEPGALLVDSGAQNLDLAVGLDMSTAYVESDNLNHRLRVLESLVLRIRRPGAICTFEPAGSTGSARRRA
ncbi:MAG: bacteriocin family protein [Chloroflexi bacterium]|nr:bacteriocin family protein [Chloroflexota bacterium]